MSKIDLRYRVLDKCFQNRKGHSISELTKKVSDALFAEGYDGKSERTIKVDINIMRSAPPRGFNAPIICKDGLYFYEDTKFSAYETLLSETEAKQLKSAIQVLSRFKGMPQFEWVNEMIPELQTKLGLISIENEAMSFENNLDYEGSKFITPLFNAIVNKTSLTIIYQDFKASAPYSISFHPYYLKQYNNRWFVFGYNELSKNQFWNMALDRIKSIEESKSKYIESDVDWEDYFSDFIGVSKQQEKPIEIKILILDAEQAAYIRTKPLHQTQKPIKQVKAGFETSITVIPNYELEKLILSFGERIKIISPKPFQKKISDRLKASHQLYK